MTTLPSPDGSSFSARETRTSPPLRRQSEAVAANAPLPNPCHAQGLRKKPTPRRTQALDAEKLALHYEDCGLRVECPYRQTSAQKHNLTAKHRRCKVHHHHQPS